jgi:hypothetical protein
MPARWGLACGMWTGIDRSDWMRQRQIPNFVSEDGHREEICESQTPLTREILEIVATRACWLGITRSVSPHGGKVQRLRRPSHLCYDAELLTPGLFVFNTDG